MSRSKNKRWFIVAALCSALILTVFVFSLHHEFGYLGPRVVLGAGAGGVGIGIYTGRTPPGWFYSYFVSFEPGMLLWPTTAPSKGGWKGVVIPLWIPFVVTAGFAAVSWRRLRARLPGRCQNCAYDLTGNASGVCPECGTAIQNAEKLNRRNRIDCFRRTHPT